MSENKINWILDLYNDGNYDVYSYNKGDDLTDGQWIPVTMGVVACYITGLIVITKYKRR